MSFIYTTAEKYNQKQQKTISGEISTNCHSA